MFSLKLIIYRGGILRFGIPSHWLEEYEEEGGGTFYEDTPDSGTLRLNVMTMEAPPSVQSLTPMSVLQGALDPGSDIAPLANGNAIATSVEQAEEEGDDLRIQFWQLATVIPPRYGRIAFFSYTVLAKQFEETKVQRELQLLDEQIREAQFSPELGEELG